MPRLYPTGCPSTAGSAFMTPAGEEASAGRSIRPAAPTAASTFRLRRPRRSLKTSPREIRCSATTWPVQSPKKRLRRKNRQQPLRPPQPPPRCAGDHGRTGTGADPAAGRAAGGSQRGASGGKYGWSGRRSVSGGIQSPGNSGVSSGNGPGCARPCGSVCDGRRGRGELWSRICGSGARADAGTWRPWSLREKLPQKPADVQSWLSAGVFYLIGI